LPPLKLVGTMLSGQQARPCGLCGQVRKLSRTHVPPQAAGNGPAVERAGDVVENGVRRPGRWTAGGMWVRGLCPDCNHLAGVAYDRAYADFARQVAKLSTPTALRLAVIPGEAPAARLAPGLVSRCVLFGMFGVNLRLRLLFPELARDLLHERVAGHGTVRWPSRLALRVGLTHPLLPGAAVLSSGVWAMRVLNQRVRHSSFADVAFPPLSWTLSPRDDGTTPELGPEITEALADASEWVQYGPDRTYVDLRSLTGALPALALPLLTDREDWIELVTDDGSDADTVVVFGRVPERRPGVAAT
jgi:hypothetical protein